MCRVSHLPQCMGADSLQLPGPAIKPISRLIYATHLSGKNTERLKQVFIRGICVLQSFDPQLPCANVVSLVESIQTVGRWSE